MKLSRFFRPRYAEQKCELLGMKFISPVGTYIKDRDNGARHAEFLLNNAYSFVIINCKDISYSLNILRKLPREYNIIAHLDVKQTYSYEGAVKSMEAAFAILYDFVDAFLISSIDSLSDDVDSLINLRMYNDDYRPIILDVPSDLLYADLDEILHYSMLSNVDGCLFSNPRLLKYANEKCKDRLCLISSNIENCEMLIEAKNNGAELFCTNSTRKTLFGLTLLGRRILRQLHKGA